MGFSILALFIGLNTAEADIRPNACNHAHVRHERRNRPQSRPNGHWVWVPRHRVWHKNHWHVVPGHWQHRPNGQRRKNGK